MLVAKYKVMPGSSNAGHVDLETAPISAVLSAPDGSEVLKTTLSEQGRFSYTSETGGEHKVCLSVLDGVDQYLVSFSMRVGSAAIDYDEAARVEHLSEVRTEVLRLKNQLEDIIREQAYQRTRETELERATQETLWRVHLWSVFQIAVLIVAGLWQVAHIKSYLVGKKRE